MRVAVTLGGTDAGRSGLSTYVRAVVPRLARKLAMQGGSLVAIGTPRDLECYSDELANTERAEIRSAWDKPAASALWHLAAAGVAAKRHRADVLLLPAANRRLTAFAPVPTVAVVHDVAAYTLRGKYDALRAAYVRAGVLPALRTAREIIAISRATRDELTRVLGRGSERISVVPNGVDAARFAPMDPSSPALRVARERLSLHEPYVLYTARLEHPGKNHVRLVQAFAASGLARTHRLVLAGQDWGAGARIREAVTAEGLSGRVDLLGFVDDTLLPALVAGADAVAMVGLAEGFGLPALEALAAGRALVAARAGALSEVAGDLAVYCDPHDTGSMAEALRGAITDEAYRARARAEGPRHAAARDWDRTAEGLLSACTRARGGR